MKFKLGISEIVLFVISLVLCIGSFTFFSACPVHENIMACHWAQRAVTALGVLIAVLALAALIIPDRRVKAGIELAVTLVSILTALVPHTVIGLCMMSSMRCVSVFRPFTILFASVTAVAALVSAILNLRKKEQ